MLQIERIITGSHILAVVVRNSNTDKTIEFPTPPDFPLQLGFHDRKKGEYIKAHEHVPFENLNIPVQELIIVKEGKVKITLFFKGKMYQDVTLSKDDMILFNCGHSLQFLEDTKLTEVKQGPYREKEYEKNFLE
jgi:hypothetical protein